MKKSIISIAICIMMLLSAMPVQGFAASEGEDTSYQEQYEMMRSRSGETSERTEGVDIRRPYVKDGNIIFDCVWFGEYYQSDDEKKDPIKWRVLDVYEDGALLLSDKNLDNKPFHTYNAKVFWSGCSLNKWLNNDFKNIAFNTVEQSAIDTKRGLYLTSSEQLLAFWSKTSAPWKSSNTEYVKKKLRNKGLDEKNTCWWVDSYGPAGFAVQIVQSNGVCGYGSWTSSDASDVMVRPCVYLDYKNKGAWSYAGTVSSDGTVNEIDADKDSQENQEPELKYFSGEKDGWPIANSYEGFGLKKDYAVPINTWLSKLITGNNHFIDGLNAITTTLMWLWGNNGMDFSTGEWGNWQGNCFGLALSSAVIYTKQYDASKLFPKTYKESASLNQYGYEYYKENGRGPLYGYHGFEDGKGKYYTIEGNENAIKFIDGLQLIQMSLEFKTRYKVFEEENFDSLIEYITDPQDNRIIMFGMPGHVTVIDKSKEYSFEIDKNGETYVLVPLYDPNFPSDSNKILGYKNVVSCIKIYPDSNEFQHVVCLWDEKNNREELSTSERMTKVPYVDENHYIQNFAMSNTTFYDVTNVDPRFLTDSVIEATLKNTLFVSGGVFEIYDEIDNSKRLIEIANGIVRECDPNVQNITRFLGDAEENSDNDFYAIELEDYNKNIIIEDGTYFVIGDNSLCGLSAEGKVESELNMDNAEITVKAVDDDAKVSINIQDGLNENYKTVNVEVSLDNNDKVTIENQNGELIIDSPADVKADVEVDDAGKIEEKNDVLLENLNEHTIGKDKLEEVSDKKDDESDKNDTDTAHTCKWENSRIAKEASCTENGEKIFICSVCNFEKTEVIPAKGHDKIKHKGKAAKCTAKGWKAYETCSRCDYTTYQVIVAKGHKWKKYYTVDKKATFKVAGSKSKHCVTCDTVKSGSKVTIAKIKKATANTLVYNGKTRTKNVTVVNNKGKKLVRGTDYTVTYKNAKSTKVVTPKAVGTYKAVVKFKGAYKGTVTKTFKIKPQATKITKLNKNGKKQFTVKWNKKTAQVTGYQIKYSTKQSMKNAKFVTVKKAKTTKRTIKNLKSKKKYYVQIRTYKNVNGVKYYSSWSKIKSVVTK